MWRINTRALFAILLLLLPLSASARLRHFVGGAAPSASQTIASVSPSTASFNQGTTAGTTITALTATMSPASPNFVAGGGSFALSTSLGPCNNTNGANNNLVQISGSNLQVSSAGQSASAGSYAFCYIAQTSAATNSPQGVAATLTISSSAPVIGAIVPSTTTFSTPASGGATLATLSLSMTSGSSAGTTITPSTTGGCSGLGANNGDIVTTGGPLPTTIDLNAASGGISASGSYDFCFVATLSGASNSPFYQDFTFTGVGAGSTVGTMTVMNMSGSSTPTNSTQTCAVSGNTCFPWREFYGFAPGLVASGNIAVPSVGGSTIRYQADDCLPTWPDGSLRGCRFTMFLPQLTANTTEQIVWKLQSGAYDHTSSGTISDITGATDFKVELSNESNLSIQYSGYVPVTTQAGAHISGGAVSSAFVNYNGGSAFGYNCANSAVTGGCGGTFGGNIVSSSFTGSISGATLTVTVAPSVGGLLTFGPQLIQGSGVTSGTVLIDQLSGTPGGVGTYGVSISQTVSSETMTTPILGVGSAFTGSVSGTTLTVSTTPTIGDLSVLPQLLAGPTGATVTAGTMITGQLTGPTGGAGTYTVSISQTVSPGTALTSNPVPNFGATDPLFHLPQVLSGAGVTAGTTIVGQVNAGTLGAPRQGNAGYYAVSIPQTISSESMTDSVQASPMAGCTTNPVISLGFDSSTKLLNSVTAVTPGSGCTHDGSGSYVCSFNMINTNTPATVVQFAKGNVEDGWDAFGPCYDNTGGAAHPWLFAHVIVEHVKDAAGATYGPEGWHAVLILSDGLYVHNGDVPGLMYDACWQQGSTAIRGFCSGGSGVTADARYEGVQHALQGAWATLDANAQVDNFDSTGALSASDSILKNVLPAPTTSDEVFWKASHLIPAVDDSSTGRSIAAGYGTVLTQTGTQSMVSDEGSYYPFCFCNMDEVPNFGNAGSHSWTSSAPYNLVMYYDVAPSASDHGKSWLQNVRMAGAGMLGVAGGNVEPATGFAANMFTTSLFPLLTPARPNVSTGAGAADYTGTGAVSSWQETSTLNQLIEWGHFPMTLLMPKFVEGERWMDDAIDLEASMAAPSGSVASRNVSLTGTPGNSSFTGISTNSSNDGHRQIAWSSYAVALGANMLPAAFVDQPYYQYIIGQDYTFMRKEIEFGPGTFADGNGSVTRSFNTTNTGVFNTFADFSNGNTTNAQFMDGFLSLSSLQVAAWEDHTYPDLDQFNAYFIQNYFVKMSGQSCPYNSIEYVVDWFQTGGDPPLSGQYQPWASVSTSNASNPQFPGLDSRQDNNVATTAGSSVVTGNNGIALDYPLNSGDAMPNGSRIMPVNITVQGEGVPNNAVGTWPPPATPSSPQEGNWYWYSPIDANDGVIENDANAATFVGSIAGNTLTVASVSIGSLATLPQTIGAVGVTGGTTITAQLTGPTGGAGTYTTSGSPQTVSSETMIADANMFVFTQNTASPWGWTPTICGSSVSGYSTANWESFNGNVGSDNRWAEYWGVAHAANAVLGSFTDANNTITNYTFNSGYTNGSINPQYLLGQSYTSPGN